MKIAIIGSAVYLAPNTPGKIIAPVKLMYDLAGFLQDMGHEAVYFGQVADTDSLISNNLGFRSFYNEWANLPFTFINAYDSLFASKVYNHAKAENYDIIHAHHLYRTAPIAIGYDIPTLITHHDSTNSTNYANFYREVKSDNIKMVALSQNSTEILPDIDWFSVVPNGVKVEEFPFEQPEDYVTWIGRIAPSKGVHHAIKIAKDLGIKIKIAGPAGPFVDLTESNYFEEQVKPLIDGNNVEYLGVLSQADSYKLLSKAKCFIFPSDGTESCPMTVIESMSCGTPIIATRNGPLKEMIVDGVNGFSFENVADMKKGVERIGEINRQTVRQYAEDHFSIRVMGKSYEDLYKKILEK